MNDLSTSTPEGKTLGGRPEGTAPRYARGTYATAKGWHNDVPAQPRQLADEQTV